MVFSYPPPPHKLGEILFLLILLILLFFFYSKHEYIYSSTIEIVVRCAVNQMLHTGFKVPDQTASCRHPISIHLRTGANWHQGSPVFYSTFLLYRTFTLHFQMSKFPWWRVRPLGKSEHSSFTPFGSGVRQLARCT